MDRIALSKRTRFNVFKRDGFSCAYCGRTPPVVTLEVDHIIPVSKKGTNTIDNLVTSCFDCNRGKSDIELTILPEKTSEKIALIKEKEDQYKAYQKMLSAIEKRITQECSEIGKVYSDFFNGWELSDSFKNTSLRKFILLLGFHEVKVSMEYACTRIYSSSESIKYFCGICWGKIKNNNN